MIQLFHVHKTYARDVEALVDVNLQIEKGEFVFLVGPSGAGKTTLLRLIFRDELPTSGQILVNGRNVAKLSEANLPSLRRSIGVIFQGFRLLRDWSVADLRRCKSQEILRIGLQDLVGRQNLVGITEELSNLADIVLGTAYELCRSELARRHGVPQLAGDAGRGRECAFVILGMGKLGGRELNFSSDIDLIFLYDEEGETAGVDGGPAGRLSNQEFSGSWARCWCGRGSASRRPTDICTGWTCGCARKAAPGRSPHR